MSNNNNDKQRNHSVITSLTYKNASKAIDFYKEVFGAIENYRLEHDGKIIHAEILVGNTTLMLVDEMPSMGGKSAETIGDVPTVLYAYVDDPIKIFNKAIKYGSKSIYPVKEQFYGDLMGVFIDPFGYKWSVAKHIKDVPVETIQKYLPKLAESRIISDHGYRKKYLKYKKKYLELKHKKN